MSLLPSNPVPDALDFRTKCFVFHGQPKVGKTTAIDLPGVLVLDSANRCGHMRRAKVVVIKNWNHVKEELAKAVKDAAVTTIAIDIASELWDVAGDDYCGRVGIRTLMDQKYKEGYGITQNEIYRELKKVTNSGKGLWLVCHSQEKPVEIPMGDGKFMTKEKWIPEGHERVVSLFRKLCYGTIFLEYINGKRILHPNLSDFFEAGTCLPLDSGKLPDAIPVGVGEYGFEKLEEEWKKATTKMA